MRLVVRGTGTDLNDPFEPRPLLRPSYMTVS